LSVGEYDGFFDVVTLIGSTVAESDEYERFFDKCLDLLKPSGILMYMDFAKLNPPGRFVAYQGELGLQVVKRRVWKLKNLDFYIFLIRGPKDIINGNLPQGDDRL
jgi:SAM-dependent methyltransferase